MGPMIERNMQSKVSAFNHSDASVYNLPGLTHQTIASRQACGSALELWKQTLVAGAATPVHFHECDEAVCILAGSGVLLANGQTTPFAADCTLAIPARQVHQIVNTGEVDLRLIAAFPQSPASVFVPSGERMSLPWERVD
jgi:mannose-6-phosphate isomerase-like protein (cupin superfamily)